MHSVRELSRHTSPGGRPQPLAFHNGALWVGSWDTSRLYEIDTAAWSVRSEIAAPGKPYGLASFGGALRVVVSLGEDDDRYVYRYVPGRPFDESERFACPEFTGSHLCADGTNLYLVQQSNRKILVLDPEGSVLREIALHERTAGIGFGADAFYTIAADEEFDDLRLATLDVTAPAPVPVEIDAMPAEARALAFDGATWFTSHRETNDIVSFAASR